MERKSIYKITGIIVAVVIVAYFSQNMCMTSEEGSMLIDPMTVKTSMPHVSGIKKYASVRALGVPVGKVERVELSKKPGENVVHFKVSINKDLVGKIAVSNPDPLGPADDPERIFAYFYVTTEGVLGDNLLDTYPGDPNRASEAARKSVRTWATREVQNVWKAEGKSWSPSEAEDQIDEKYRQLIKTVENIDKGYIEDGMFLRTKKMDKQEMGKFLERKIAAQALSPF
jgi:hypothetical protein